MNDLKSTKDQRKKLFHKKYDTDHRHRKRHLLNQIKSFFVLVLLHESFFDEIKNNHPQFSKVEFNVTRYRIGYIATIYCLVLGFRDQAGPVCCFKCFDYEFLS